MTLMTRMQKGAKTEMVRVVAAIGGIALVTAPRIVRTKELVAHWRRESPADPDASHGR